MLFEQLSLFSRLLLLTARILQSQSVDLLLLVYLNSSLFKVFLLRKPYFLAGITLLIALSN